MKKLSFLSGLWLALLLAACSTVNPLSHAETTEQRVYAVYGTFVIFEEKIADLLETRGQDLPASVVNGMVNADGRAKPVADSLLDAYILYLDVKAAVEAGEEPQEKLTIALSELDSWLGRLVPLINDMVAAVRGAN